MNVLRELILMWFLEFEVVYSAFQSVERKIQISRIAWKYSHGTSWELASLVLVYQNDTMAKTELLYLKNVGA